ncbi:hypothetical protein SUGI_1107540 [Cryptomeria japonica]|nr:hypothetical protein SUGI_1107540 [Cryptomeria japonica]
MMNKSFISLLLVLLIVCSIGMWLRVGLRVVDRGDDTFQPFVISLTLDVVLEKVIRHRPQRRCPMARSLTTPFVVGSPFLMLKFFLKPIAARVEFEMFIVARPKGC